MAKSIASDEDRADKVGKLLPAEVTGLYLTLRAYINDPNSEYYGYFLFGAAGLATLASLLYLYYVRGVTSPTHILVYVSTFLIWAVSMDVDHIKTAFAIKWPIEWLVGLLSTTAAFVLPFIPSGRVASTGPKSGDGFNTVPATV